MTRASAVGWMSTHVVPWRIHRRHGRSLEHLALLSLHKAQALETCSRFDLFGLGTCPSRTAADPKSCQSVRQVLSTATLVCLWWYSTWSSPFHYDVLVAQYDRKRQPQRSTARACARAGQPCLPPSSSSVPAAVQPRPFGSPGGTLCLFTTHSCVFRPMKDFCSARSLGLTGATRGLALSSAVCVDFLGHRDEEP